MAEENCEAGREEDVEVFFLLYNLLSPFWFSFGIRHGAIAVVQRRTEQVLVVHYEGWKAVWHGLGTGLKPKEYGLEKFRDGEFMWRNCIWKGLAPCGCRYLGRTEETFAKVEHLVEELKLEWPGLSYHFFWRNCLHFSGYLAHRIGAATGLVGFWDVYILPTIWGLILYACGGFLLFDLPWWTAVCTLFGQQRSNAAASQQLESEVPLSSAESLQSYAVEKLDVVLEMDKAAEALLWPTQLPAKRALALYMQARRQEGSDTEAGSTSDASNTHADEASSTSGSDDAVAGPGLPACAIPDAPTTPATPVGKQGLVEHGPGCSPLLAWPVPQQAVQAASAATVWHEADEPQPGLDSYMTLPPVHLLDHAIQDVGPTVDMLVDQLLAAVVHDSDVEPISTHPPGQAVKDAGLAAGPPLDQLVAVLSQDIDMDLLAAHVLNPSAEQDAGLAVDTLLDQVMAAIVQDEDQGEQDFIEFCLAMPPSAVGRMLVGGEESAQPGVCAWQRPCGPPAAPTDPAELVEVVGTWDFQLSAGARLDRGCESPGSSSPQTSEPADDSGMSAGVSTGHDDWLASSPQACESPECSESSSDFELDFATSDADLLQQAALCSTPRAFARGFSLSEAALMQDAGAGALPDLGLSWALSEPGMLQDGPGKRHQAPAPAAAELDLVEEWDGPQSDTSQSEPEDDGDGDGQRVLGLALPAEAARAEPSTSLLRRAPSKVVPVPIDSPMAFMLALGDSPATMAAPRAAWTCHAAHEEDDAASIPAAAGLVSALNSGWNAPYAGCKAQPTLPGIHGTAVLGDDAEWQSPGRPVISTQEPVSPALPFPPSFAGGDTRGPPRVLLLSASRGRAVGTALALASISPSRTDTLRVEDIWSDASAEVLDVNVNVEGGVLASPNRVLEA